MFILPNRPFDLHYHYRAFKVSEVAAIDIGEYPDKGGRFHVCAILAGSGTECQYSLEKTLKDAIRVRDELIEKIEKHGE